MRQRRRPQDQSSWRARIARQTMTTRIVVAMAAIVALLGMPAAASAASVVATIPLGAGTFEASVNPSTSRLYVTNYSAGSMSVVDTTTNAVLTTLPLTSSPVMLDVNPVTNRVYVTHQGAGNALTVLDGATNSVITVIPISNPFSPRVNEVTNRIYVALTFGGGVTVLNGATNAIVTTVPTSGDSTIGIAVDQSRNLVYASDRHANVVDVVDGATNTVLDTIALGFSPGQLEVDESLNKLYVVDSGGSAVAVIDAATGSVAGSIAVEQQPTGIALNQATHRTYVSNLASNTVSVIDNATDAVIDTVAVGNSPAWLGLDRSTGRVYVPNTGSGGGVSVIEDPVAPANPCDITQDHSIESVTPVDLTFYNDTDAMVTVYWLDFGGRQREWFTMEPDDVVTQGTYLTHPWLMLDPDTGECVGYTLAHDGEYHITHAAAPPADSDGDGLLDSWETNGIDADGNGTIDLALNLPPFNADPQHKDQYLEVDYMAAPAPQPGTLADVTAAFAAAPVANPDSTSGIRLHAMLGEVVPTYASVCFSNCTDFPAPASFQGLKSGGPAECDGYFGTPAERASGNCAAILAARRLAFHYAIFGQSYSETPGSSGIAEIGGNDLMVTVAGKTPEWIVAAGGMESAEAGTLMHELGHNLGFEHGGGDSINCKPNYQSVMSYSYQVPNLDPARPLDYSGEELPALFEGGLDEAAGIGASSGSVVFGLGGTPTVLTDATGPVDWNGDGVLDSGVGADVNYILKANGAPLCPAGAGELLLGHDDWSSVIYNFRLTPGFANGVADPRPPTPTTELTSAEALDTAKAVDSDGDGIPNSSESVCTVTNAYVQGSAKYQNATPKQRSSADAQVRNVCGVVEKITRTTKPEQKKGLVAGFKDKVDGLRSGGWLTVAQANTLKAMIDTL